MALGYVIHRSQVIQQSLVSTGRVKPVLAHHVLIATFITDMMQASYALLVYTYGG